MTKDELTLAHELALASGAAYETSNNLDPQKCQWAATLSNINFITSGKSQIDAVLLGDSGNRQIVAFRGTLPPIGVENVSRPQSVMRDWWNNTKAELGASEGLPGRVHPGFAESFKGLLNNGLQDSVEAAIKAGRKLQLTGHSKGGALATLAACHFAQQGIAVDVVVTFGSAQVGDEAFRAAYEKLGLRHQRFEHAHDLVPHEPEVGVPGLSLIPARPDYRAVGTLRYLNDRGELDARAAEIINAERRLERDRRLALLTEMPSVLKVLTDPMTNLPETLPLLADHAIDQFHPDLTFVRKLTQIPGLSMLRLTSYAEVLEKLCQ